jgi:signal transduction histidine kinase
MNAIDEQKGAGAGYIEITTAFDEKYIYVTVEDRGSGIPEEHLSRIFEPFFTTKGMGEGTGLGLAISQRVVKEHGGNIRVESELGEGAVFTVQLPYVY